MTVSSDSAWPLPTGLALAGIAATDEHLGNSEPPLTGYHGCCGTPNPPGKWG